MPKAKIDAVRKAFLLRSDLEPRLVGYAEKNGWTQAQVINHALRTFFDAEDMKNFVSSMDSEKLAKIMIQEAMKYQDKDELKNSLLDIASGKVSS